MQDLHNDILCSRAISPVNETGNAALVSQVIDTANFDSLEFVIATGSLADAGATFTVLVEDGPTTGVADGEVADAYLIGTEAGASFTQAEDNQVFKIGYKGIKRYVRLTITPAANATDAYISAVAIQSHARKLPQSDQSI